MCWGVLGWEKNCKGEMKSFQDGQDQSETEGKAGEDKVEDVYEMWLTKINPKILKNLIFSSFFFKDTDMDFLMLCDYHHNRVRFCD